MAHRSQARAQYFRPVVKGAVHVRPGVRRATQAFAAGSLVDGGDQPLPRNRVQNLGLDGDAAHEGLGARTQILQLTQQPRRRQHRRSEVERRIRFSRLGDRHSDSQRAGLGAFDECEIELQLLAQRRVEIIGEMLQFVSGNIRDLGNEDKTVGAELCFWEGPPAE